MGRERARVLLFAAWMATIPLLAYVANVPFLLVFVGYVVGAAVIELYTRTLEPSSLTPVERWMPRVAKAVLTVIAAGFALLLAFTLFALLVAWLTS